MSTRWGVLIALFLAAVPTVARAGGQPPPPIVYIYDDLGRIAAVIDPGASGNNVARYSYDSAGNLTAITRQASSTVTVISFTPGCGVADASATGGAPGTIVTIYGTGFSATATQNAVAFNGAAPVTPTSASATQLVVTVPLGATTGTFTVASPGGAATSPRPFKVDGCGAPTITAFTTIPGQSCTPPTNCPSGTTPSCLQHVGLLGAAATITGTNFDPTVTNDLPGFNNQVAAVTSATATSIGTQVPSIGTSGKIRVATPLGTAVSPADFFAPPPGKTVADMDLCNLGRLSPPTSSGTLTIGSAGKTSELLFDGTSGRRICISITNPACSGSNCELSFELLTPAGNQLFYSPCLVQYCPPTTFFDNTLLPATGSYAAVLLPSTAGTTGSAKLTVYDVPNDATQFMTLNGTPVTLANSSVCQNARAYFTGFRGHRVSVKLTANSGLAVLSLIYGETGGYGPTIWGPICTGGGCAPDYGFIEPATLPNDGQYLLFFDPSTTVIGSVTVMAYDVPPDQTQPAIVVNGSSVPVTLNTPGQNALLPISGTAAGSISVHVTSNTFTTNDCVTVTLIDTTTNTPLASLVHSCGTSFALPPGSVNATDSYAVSVDPVGPNIGSLSVSAAE